MAEQQSLLQPPCPMKESLKRLRFEKYCRFHKDRGHTIEDCFSLRAEIEKLIERGYLENFVDKSRDQRRHNKCHDYPWEQQKERSETNNQLDLNDENLPTRDVIAVITGGPACGDTNNARKALLRAVERDQCSSFTAPLQLMFEISRTHKELSFGESDLNAQYDEHNDALVISAIISNFWIKKILVDSGSSADIIFYNVFEKLVINDAQLIPMNTPLVSFGGKVVDALGEVTLPLSLGSYPYQATNMVKFLVVKSHSAYNVILGRPSFNLFRAIGSIYHMKLKFPTPEGVGKVVGDSWQARECHIIILQGSVESRKRASTIENPSKGKTQKLQYCPGDSGVHVIEKESNENDKLTATETLEVMLGNPKKTSKIGSDLLPELDKTLIKLPQHNAEIFAKGKYAPLEMPTKYALHKFNKDPRMKWGKLKNSYT